MWLVKVFAELLELLEGLFLVLDQVLATLTLYPFLKVTSRILLGLYRVELVHYCVEGFFLLEYHLSQGLFRHKVDYLLPVSDFEPCY